MSCTTCRELLPLFVESDLRPDETAPLHAHLAACAACREEEEGLRASQAFWKGAPEPELGETFHADVRRAVRTRIAREVEEKEARSRRWSFLRAWGALAGAAAALALVFLLVDRPATPPPRLAAAPTSRPVATAPVPAPAVAAVAPERVASASVPLVRRGVRRRRTLEPRSVPPEENVPTLARVTRIEMTTENPNVRIIWVANAAETTPL